MPQAFQSKEIKMELEALKSLLDICDAEVDDFCQLGTTVKDTAHGPLIHIDNGGDTLAVAHLDSYGPSLPRIVWNAKGNVSVHCYQLDDRLGAWVILDLLPRFTDVKYDILLCDSEESGNSTAQYFKTKKEYNWIWEFDRAGTDVVMYDYHTQELEDLLEGNGFEVDYGAYTDICYLEHLGVSGFNFGVGYHQQHSDKCYAYLRDTYCMVAKFRRFLEEYHSTKFVHDPSKTKSRFSGYNWYESRDDFHSKFAYEDDGPIFRRNEDGDWVKVTEDDFRGCLAGTDEDRVVCESCREVLDDTNLCPYCDYSRYWAAVTALEDEEFAAEYFEHMEMKSREELDEIEKDDEEIDGYCEAIERYLKHERDRQMASIKPTKKSRKEIIHAGD